MAEPGDSGPVWPVPVAWGALALAVFRGGARPSWHSEAACAEVPELFEGRQGQSQRARQVCADCPVRRECLRDILEWETGTGTRAAFPVGTRAGLTAMQRSELYQAMPKSVGLSGVQRRKPRRR